MRLLWTPITSSASLAGCCAHEHDGPGTSLLWPRWSCPRKTPGAHARCNSTHTWVSVGRHALHMAKLAKSD
jgi:hypothetical protein